MARPSNASGKSQLCGWHVACFVAQSTAGADVPPAVWAAVMSAPFTQPLSVRAHFWLRFAGLAIIVAAQFGPRILGTFTVAPAPAARIASVAH